MSPRTLAPCLSSPNWVSIQVQDAGHAIAPFAMRGEYRQSWTTRVEFLLLLNGGLS